MVSLVNGGGDPGATGCDAAPAPRLHRFAEAFPHSQETSICAADWRPALLELGNRVAVALGPPCLPAPLSDPVDCIVTEQSVPDGPPRLLPGVELRIDRGGCTPPNGTLLSVDCANGPTAMPPLAPRSAVHQHN
jgi:hypothetical protein